MLQLSQFCDRYRSLSVHKQLYIVVQTTDSDRKSQRREVSLGIITLFNSIKGVCIVLVYMSGCRVHPSVRIPVPSWAGGAIDRVVIYASAFGRPVPLVPSISMGVGWDAGARSVTSHGDNFNSHCVQVSLVPSAAWEAAVRHSCEYLLRIAADGRPHQRTIILHYHLLMAQ